MTCTLLSLSEPFEAAFRKLAAQGFDTDVAASAARLWYEETLAAAE